MSTSVDLRSIMEMDQPRQLRDVNFEEWDDGHIACQAYQPTEVDQPWPYRFQHGDSVWVHSTDFHWCLGTVSGRPKVGRTREVNIFRVIYDGKFRIWVSPLEGELKPDTPHIRKLVDKAY
ncbi:uncharacterized protein EDB91DRAFT_1061153 [Suillus paluster]|uniref:uncharacterized protein n=1 Tax=Suillus paluster TaxID=48578 RepID=UPI001B881991|nr:uncharacterized protein EDB91DRAFT_1061153 [Suillus paluster]KAG1727477.1 hypothetical protein EDB91DRAFT_1061153 [Suillus paluster]